MIQSLEIQNIGKRKANNDIHKNRREFHDIKKPRVLKKTTTNSSLPITLYRSELCLSVNKFSTTIISAETGSGKSTQLPQYLADSMTNIGCIVCTQPRRVAAITIAQRVALERNCEIGQEVGYGIRFEDKTSFKTKIKYVTDGVLLREIMGDKELSKYKVIILDEAHERSLQTDILMGLLKALQLRRVDLKIVVMSATLQIDLFMGFFQDCNVISIPGRQFPVDIYYLKSPEDDYIDAAMLACLQIHEQEEAGGVLVFLPGQDEIENLQSLLEKHLPDIKCKHQQNSFTSSSSTSEYKVSSIENSFVIRPLYASLPPEEQLKAFKPSTANIRKFVLSTNIAETSVTLSGIKYVVDTGCVKTRFMAKGTGMEMLKITPVSQSQANQRAGRAGRESAGKCFRLYSESAFEKLEISTIPEIQRVNISQVILQLKVLGIKSLDTFHFISPPSKESLKKSLEELLLLEAIDSSQELTEHGVYMSKLPLDPLFSNLLLKANKFRCTNEILIAVSMLSSDNIFLQPHKEEIRVKALNSHLKFKHKDGDLLTLVSIYDSWMKANCDSSWASNNYLSQRSLMHSKSVLQQLVSILDGLSIDSTISSLPNKDPFLQCLASGFSINVAKLNSSIDLSKSTNKTSNGRILYKDEKKGSIAQYKTLKGGQDVFIHPSSVLFSSKKLPEYVVFAELLVTSKQYMRNVTAINMNWLPVLLPHLFQGLHYEK